MTTMKLADIVIGDWDRRDLGDVDALAQSIATRGLLQPPAVTADGQLISGRRRLAALEKLGWTEIPVHVVSGLDEEVELLLAQHEADELHKSLTPSEAVARGKRIKGAIAKQAARQKRSGKSADGRAGGRGRQKPSRNLREGLAANGDAGNRHERETGARVAEAVAMKSKTYQKAEQIVDAATADPERFGDLAARMDATGKVDGPFKELQKRLNSEPDPEPAPERHPYSQLLVNWLQTISFETHGIEIERGGIEAMLQERGKWDWRHTVPEFLLPQMKDLISKLIRYRKAVQNALPE
jgi:ParB-like chromosome segregation protein Spo0J